MLHGFVRSAPVALGKPNPAWREQSWAVAVMAIAAVLLSWLTAIISFARSVPAIGRSLAWTCRCSLPALLLYSRRARSNDEMLNRAPSWEWQSMSDQLVVLSAVLLNIAGCAWQALAMNVHWKQVRGSGAPPQMRLRLTASAAFLISLVLCNLTDHATIAALVWVMALTGSALLVALTLTWWPSCLRPLSWLGGSGSKGQIEP